MLITSKILMTVALLLLFFAYLNFAPTALSSSAIAGYTKNHFVREIVFGAVLAGLTLFLIYQQIDLRQWLIILFFGSVVVLPFWIAAMFGWTTEGMQQAWQGEISPRSAYILHGSQTALFYIGIALMYFSIPEAEGAT
jgi:hypothetical protein